MISSTMTEITYKNVPTILISDRKKRAKIKNSEFFKRPNYLQYNS